ncbi:uncharacterized protein LOC110693213 isoform X2 [Chenopodium quinoa]|uniref:uncharacterized protein LOC110693213 isoform X2 n=1 Tax=Chenopodium quinoa TaxID=63459 RepID=UPI000B76F264|nr:uncharacterized protein LOC110693213 isoform X2 [Chenopodium quinoa]
MVMFQSLFQSPCLCLYVCMNLPRLRERIEMIIEVDEFSFVQDDNYFMIVEDQRWFNLIIRCMLVEIPCAEVLLTRHIKRAKRIRARLREERSQRIDRYKSRLALLLPPNRNMQE